MGAEGVQPVRGVSSLALVAKLPSPLKTLVQSGRPLFLRFLRELLLTAPPVAHPGWAGRMAAAVVFGVARGLGLGGAAQLYALGYLGRWSAAWSVLGPRAGWGLDLGSALGLVTALHWWQRKAEQAGPTPAADLLWPVVAAVTLLVLRTLWWSWSLRLVGAVAVGGLWIAMGRLLERAGATEGHALILPNLRQALAAGAAASLGCFLGLSTVGVLIAVALLARLRPGPAVRLALAAASLAFLLPALAHLPQALGAWPQAVGALLGSAAGSMALQAAAERWQRRLWTYLGSYVATLGAALVLLGVFVP